MNDERTNLLSVAALVEAYDQYIKFLTKEANLLDEFAGVHGIRRPKHIIEQGVHLRQEINKYRVELELDPLFPGEKK